jgi:hypothetical protein
MIASRLQVAALIARSLKVVRAIPLVDLRQINRARLKSAIYFLLSEPNTNYNSS